MTSKFPTVASRRHQENMTDLISHDGCMALTRKFYRPGYWLGSKKRLPSQINKGVRATLGDVIRGEKPWPVLLFGGVGTGKTCASLCILDYFGGLYNTSIALRDELIAAQKGNSYWTSGYPRTTTEIWNGIKSTNLLVLDELAGRQQESEFQCEVTQRVIDHRHGTPLVVISNRNLGQISRILDDRIASRLAAGTVICTNGADRRVTTIC